MKKTGFPIVRSLCGVAVLLTLTLGTASADENARDETQGFGSDSSWYYDTPPDRQPEYSIAQQKAMARADQRMARLDMARWHGYSAGRPTHTAGTFSNIHSPSWGWPVGRPVTWYVPRSTVVILVR